MTINPPISELKNVRPRGAEPRTIPPGGTGAGVKLIIGLGNPGVEYKNTYHNVGFIAIDYLAKNLRAEPISIPSRHHFTAFKTNRFYLAKPSSFMNQSGKPTAEIIKFFKTPPEQTLIIHDDSDIKLGSYKFSFGRGGAGHNGVQSIIDTLKTSTEGQSASGGKNFWRLRLGIRPISKHPTPASRLKAGDFVLKNIKPAHLKIFYSVVGDIIVKLTENEKP